jgi:hypothetical protein
MSTLTKVALGMMGRLRRSQRSEQQRHQFRYRHRRRSCVGGRRLLPAPVRAQSECHLSDHHAGREAARNRSATERSIRALIRDGHPRRCGDLRCRHADAAGDGTRSVLFAVVASDRRQCLARHWIAARIQARGAGDGISVLFPVRKDVTLG